MREIEAFFAPSVTSVSALQSGSVVATRNGPTGTVTFPGGTDTLRVAFNPGSNPFRAGSSYAGSTVPSTPTVTNPGFSTTATGLSISAGSNVFDISLPAIETQRADRQSSTQPYALSFNPINDLQFDDSPATQATNRFSALTQNIAPIAVADTFSPLLSQIQSATGTPIPFPLPVLTQGRDSDPDHAAATLTVSPATPTLSENYGSVTVNGTGDGYIYTPPATLDTSPRTVTFSYSAVDEESGTSSLAEVTINVPAGAPPVEVADLVANPDLFRIQEDAALTDGDVKLDNGSGPDDLDGVALADLTFSAGDPSSGTLTFRMDGTFDYVPEPNFEGDATFTYQITDGTAVDNAVVTLRVAGGNDAPVVAPIQLISVNESREPFTTDLLSPSSVSDPDDDPLNAINVNVEITRIPETPQNTIDDGAVSVDANIVTINPMAFERLDNDETADILITYTVTDGIEEVENTLSLTIIGLDNGLGRQAGAYADTLSARYSSNLFGAHFGTQSEAPSSCLNCHATLETVNADVDTVDECIQTPAVFTQYGLDICLDRDASAEPLTDLVRRLATAEAEYAPKLAPTDTLQVLQSSSAGTPIGDPVQAASTGQDVFGATARIHSYLISAGEDSPPAETDATGQFRIDENGQISVASNTLEAGRYTLIVLPVNDAGQRDNAGIRVDAPGFFNQNPGPESAVTIEVVGDLPTPVDDIANALAGQANTIAVLSNDTGGTAESITIETQPQNGTVAVNDDLSLSYTPNAGFTGEDSFTYISQNSTGVANRSARVALTVIPAEGVRAVNDQGTAIVGRTTVVDVLANDDNVRRDGAGATVVSIVSGTDPQTEGVATLQGQSISFVPAADFAGTATLTYRAENPTATGSFGSNATVTFSVLQVGTGAIAAQVTDPELLKVANAFEQSCLIVGGQATQDLAGSQFLEVCTRLTIAAQDGEDLTQAMRALRNEEHFAAVDATMTVARGLGRVVDRRMSQIRDGGARGVNAEGIDIRIGDHSIPTEMVTQALRGYLGLEDDPFDNPTWGLFVAGDIAWVERDETSTSEGFDLEATNLMIGFDRVYSDTSSLGFSLGYSETDTDFAGGGSLDSKGYQATLYGIRKDFLLPDLTFEGFVSVGRMSFDMDRPINFTNGGVTTDTFATSEFDGRYLNIRPKLSFSNLVGREGASLQELQAATRLTWSASLDYLLMDIDDYVEEGGDGLALDVQSETYESLILAFGLDASRPVAFGPNTRAEIYGGIEIRGELLDKNRTVSSAFRAAGPDAPRFVVTEEGTHGLGAGIEIGTVFSIGTNGHLDLSYGYDISGGDLKTQHLTLGYRQEMSRNSSVSMNVTRSFSSTGADGALAEFSYQSRF